MKRDTPRRPPATTRRGGYALILVMIAITVVTVVSMGVLTSLTPATVLASNSRHGAEAGVVARGGIDAVEAYLHDKTQQWDTHQGQKTEGWWFTDAPLGGGTFSVHAERTDGDPGVDNEAFSNADRVTVTSVGKVDGVTAIATRILGAIEDDGSIKVLVVLDNQSAPSSGSQDQYRVDQMGGWGFTVSYLDSTASQAAYDTAVLGKDVAYIVENVLSSDVENKLKNVSIGVVNEEGGLYDNFGFASSFGGPTGTTIWVDDNTHPITSGLAAGTVTIANSSTEFRDASGTISANATILARRSSGGNPQLAVMQAGDALYNGGTAAGRRVHLPWGGNSFDVTRLNAAGLDIMKRSIEWAADREYAGALAYWNLDETVGNTATDVRNGFNGTLYNGVTLGDPGKIGTGLTFDGSNDHVEVAHDDAMLIDAGTVAFWIKPATVTPGHQGLFSKDSTDYDTGGHLHMALNGSKAWTRIQTTSSKVNLYSASGAITAGNWHHVAFSFGPAGCTLYVDGAQVDSNAYSGGLGTTSGGIGNYEPLVFGASTRASGNLTKNTLKFYYSGGMDEVLWFDRQLSAAEVYSLFNK